MKSLMLLLSLLLVSGAATAEVYKWVDDKGQVHYEDHPKGGQDEKISIDDSASDKVDALKINKPDTQTLLKEMEQSRKQREKTRHKKQNAQRKQDQKCLSERNKLRMLEARMQKKYSEFSNDRPASYKRQEAEVADRKKYLDTYCN